MGWFNQCHRCGRKDVDLLTTGTRLYCIECDEIRKCESEIRYLEGQMIRQRIRNRYFGDDYV